jgi:hypothetical protein
VNLTRAIALSASMLLALVSLAAAEVVQRGDVRVTMSGELSPRTLLRHGQTPVAVSVGGRVSSVDGSAAPPQLKSLRIDINRHGRFDGVGLPICRMPQILSASSARALASCGPALVGDGRFTAYIRLPEQPPYPTQGRLLLFNGREGGRPVLFAQIYAPRPFATSFVITFEIKQLGHGTFGTALTAFLPEALGDWGYLTGIEMRLFRRYSFRGERRSFLSASCPAPAGFKSTTFPMARMSFGFAGVAPMEETLVRSCGARRGGARPAP